MNGPLGHGRGGDGAVGANEKEVRLAGVPVQIAVARRFVAEAVGPGHPGRADAMLLTSETGTNAIAHSKSGRPGGSFLLNVRWTESWVRGVRRR